MTLKALILNQLSSLLNEKIDSLNKSINETIESRDQQTKSSAGDKHETSRAMMQIELDNLSMQLKKNNALKFELSKIDLSKKHQAVDRGSLVLTNEGSYFISIGIGKVIIDNDTFYCISLGSPIGKELYNKKTGDSFLFMNKEFIIQKIL